MKTIALFFGGLSNEAEVSIMSARNVIKYFDYKQYKLKLIYWNKRDGLFYLLKDIDDVNKNFNKNILIEDFAKLFDIALPMTHGRYGEDGVLQSILESQKIKYCGCRVLSSALCMDKAVFKDLMSSRNYNQTKYAYLDFSLAGRDEIRIFKENVKSKFKLPVYVKPANSGSSVGITKVSSVKELESAIKEALKSDSKILIEEGLINPREVEIAIIGNGKLIISEPGELKLAKEFYDYNDKYKLGEAKVVIPAKINLSLLKKIKVLAEEIYLFAGCQGFARVDFFIHSNRVYINEINTLPGFTDISMFPMLMMNNGLSYTEILNKIIELVD